MQAFAAAEGFAELTIRAKVRRVVLVVIHGSDVCLGGFMPLRVVFTNRHSTPVPHCLAPRAGCVGTAMAHGDGAAGGSQGWQAAAGETTHDAHATSMLCVDPRGGGGSCAPLLDAWAAPRANGLYRCQRRAATEL